MNKNHGAMVAVAIAFITVSCVSLVGFDESEADDTGSEGPFEVNGTHYGSLSEAISAAKFGNTINMVEDAETEKVTFTDGNRTLDLGGNTLTIVGDSTGAGIQIMGMNITITNGAIVDARDADVRAGGHTVISVAGIGISLTVDDVDITFYDSLDSASNYNYGAEVRDTGALQLTGTTSIVSVPSEGATDGSVGVYIQGAPKYGKTTTLTVADEAKISVGTVGVAGNGSTDPDYGGTAISITGGTIEATSGMGIYHPQSGELSISGNGTTVSGPTGIEIRAGSLTMTGGSVVSTSDTFSSEANGSGSTTVGAGIAVVQHTSKLDVSLSISGGTVAGVKALYEANLQGNDPTDLERITLSIIGGDFSTTGDGDDAAAVDVGDVDQIGKFISGGTFSDNVGEYCVDGFSCKETDSGFAASYDGEDAVAQIGDLRYQTLAQAIAAVPTDGTQTTITILRDFTMDEGDLVTVLEGQDIVLDLAGKRITVDSADTLRPIINYGTLTITGDGTIDTSAGSSYGTVGNYGTLTIEDGSFLGKYTQDGTLIRTYAGSSTTIYGGYFDGSPGAVASEGACTIYGGTFTSDCCSSCSQSWAYTVRNLGGTMTIYDADVTGTQGALSTSNGYLEVRGGTFTTRHCPNDPSHNTSSFYALYVAGEYGKTSCTIYDGTFETYYRSTVLVGNSNDGGIQEEATIVVMGGSFSSQNDSVDVISVDGDTATAPSATVYGGSFDRQVDRSIIAPGYTAEYDSSTGTYTAREVTPGESEASVTDDDGDTLYFETLEDALEFAPDGSTVVLRDDVSLSSTIDYDFGKNLTLDLYGNTISNTGYVFEITDGTLTIKDSTAEMSMNEDWTVNYTGGSVYSSSAHAIRVSGESSSGLVLLSGKIESDGNCGVYVIGNLTPGDDVPAYDSSFIMEGGFIDAREFGAVVAGDGGVMTINGGYIVTIDNAAVGGNGTHNTTEDYGGTVMNINGGTLVSNIVSDGYISCGIYHPQKGVLNITSGTIVSTNGIGILMRGGELNMTGGEIIAYGTGEGKVGDSNVLTSGSGIFVDIRSNYYDNANIDVGVEDGTITSEGDAIMFLDSEGDSDPKDYIQVSGGSFSSDVTEFCAQGLMASDDGSGTYTIGDAPKAVVTFSYEPVSPSDDQNVTVTVTVTGVQAGTEITYVWNGESETTTETTKTYTVSAGTTGSQSLSVSFTSYGIDYTDEWSHSFYGNHTVTVEFPSELGMSDQVFSVRDGEAFDLGSIDISGVPDGYVITGYTGYDSGTPVTSDVTITAEHGISEPSVTYSFEYHDGYTVIVLRASHPLADAYGFAVNDGQSIIDVDYDGTLVVRESGTYSIVVAAFIGGPDSETYGIKVIENVAVTVESGSYPVNPPVTPGDDDGYVPILPPEIVINQSGGSDDSTVGIAACAAAAVAAAIIVLILVAEYRKR